MGEGILEGLRIYMPESDGAEDTADEVIIEAGPGQEQKAEWTSGSAQQNGMPVVNNNPIFIQQNGDGNMVIPNYGTININKR